MLERKPLKVIIQIVTLTYAKYVNSMKRLKVLNFRQKACQDTILLLKICRATNYLRKVYGLQNLLISKKIVAN